MVAVTETSAGLQVSATAGPERSQQSLPRPSAQFRPATDTAALASAEGAKTEAAPVPSPIGFTLYYDSDLQRLILEAREPVSGYVIVQIPPKYVVKQFSATARAQLEAARGKGLNDAV